MPGASGRESTRSQGSPSRSLREVTTNGPQEDRQGAGATRRALAGAEAPLDRGAVAAVTQEEDRPCPARNRADCLREGRPHLAGAAEAAEAAEDPETEGVPAAGRRETNAWEMSKRRW